MKSPDAAQEGPFTGKLAVVTGAGSGIGRATALSLARQGAQVLALGRSASVEETASVLRNHCATSGHRIVDCSDRRAVEATFQEILQAYGKVDILVNAVGRSAGPRRGEFWRSDPEVWDEVMNTSLRSTMLCCRQVVPFMRERRQGKIVNISSVSWMVPTPTFSEYAAAKAGVVGFTRVLAVELAPFGINVNAISPGPVATPATDRHPPELRQQMTASIPLGRFGFPEEIAAGVSFLVSDQASFVVGHNLVISGGRGIG